MPGQTFVARLSCLPLISLAPVSGVLSAKSVHATVSRSEFWSKIPQRNVEVFNRVGPTGDTIAQVTKHTRKALGLMDGPYNSLEECPGQHTPNTPSNLRVKVMKREHGVLHSRTRTQTVVVGMFPTVGDNCRPFPSEALVMLESRDGPSQALHDNIFGGCTSCFYFVAFSAMLPTEQRAAAQKLCGSQ